MDRKNTKILITGGGSEEPIDTVRSITNFSTGKTAASFADFFCQNGFSVTLITNTRSAKPNNKNVNLIEYKTFAELHSVLKQECESKKYSVVIHAAAVSDFSPEIIYMDGKIFSPGSLAKIPSGTELVIKMKKNPKLVNGIKEWAGKNTTLIAFKLTSKATEEEQKDAVKKLLESAASNKTRADFVVANDLSLMQNGKRPSIIYKNDLTVKTRTVTQQDLENELLSIITNKG